MPTFGRVRAASHLRRELLAEGWRCCATPAGSHAAPATLHDAVIDWTTTSIPNTAAGALRQAQRWSLDSPSHNFDAEDWWFSLDFQTRPPSPGESVYLCFGGLATVADVWLNGEQILHSENMFRSHRIDVGARLRAENQLQMRFIALDTLLAAKRPRPRWKAPMIQHQQLRWLRTTLLGRTPSWSPPAAAVGPWRDVWLERQQIVRVDRPLLRTILNKGAGELAFRCQMELMSQGVEFVRGELTLTRNSQSISAAVAYDGHKDLSGSLAVASPDLWWPHTQGEPCLYAAVLTIIVKHQNSEHRIEVELGNTGFRKLTLDKTAGNFTISVNEQLIFCRGACWTPLDIVTLQSTPEALRYALLQVRDAGMNMLRISGTMVYEDDGFLDLCDELGILLWQDFMFANMDYPETPEFIADINVEVEQQLARLSGRPCLAILCGNSEGEQQAAMFGATRDRWSPDLFHQHIPQFVTSTCPDIPYWPSSAHGGALPYQNDTGTTSYYGVGAYLRPLEDARRSEVRFASECLAFANVPDPSCIVSMPNGLSLKTHHPQWKARTPRDLGAGWDFEDVRDHYLKLLFDVDPAALRYSNHERYLELSRIVTGEVMAATFNEWRNAKSRCNGGLIWFLRDLWPGAGWGVIDALGQPKAAYYYLRRALQPISISLSDEGCNGLYLHLCNEHSNALAGSIELNWYQHSTKLSAARIEIHLDAREKMQVACASLLDYFADLNHAYRFGPPMCDLVTARLLDAGGQLLAEDFCWPTGRPAQQTDLGLMAQAMLLSDGTIALVISTQQFAQSVVVHADGFKVSDQYFHLAPNSQRIVQLAHHDPSKPLRGEVTAANCSKTVHFNTK